MDRDQDFLLPPSMSEWLGPDHLVWFLIAAVERLDTSAFHAGSRRGGVGRAGYDPVMLLTLFVYAMAHGVSSSRQIERLCHTDVAFRVICAQDVPDHTVLARFRQRHEQALIDLLGASLELAAELGMVRLGVVALDGTKIAANAALSSTRREARLRELAAEYVDRAAESDRVEDSQHGPTVRGDEVPQGLRDRSDRAGRISRALERIEAQKQAERQVEEDRREAVERFDQAVATGRAVRGPAPKGVDVVARARQTWQRERTAAAARYQDWLERAEQARASGRGGLPGRPSVPPDEHTRVKAARARLDTAEAAAAAAAEESSPVPDDADAADQKHYRANMTDPDSQKMRARHGGWLQGFNCQTAVSSDGLFVSARVCDDTNDLGQFIATMHAVEQAADRLDKTVGTLLADAGYDSNANHAAPGPDRVIALASPPSATTRSGRDNSARQAMAERLTTEAGKALYARRSPIVEPPNSWLKEGRGLRRFRRRGRAAVESELSFACAVTNLLRINTHGITTSQLATS